MNRAPARRTQQDRILRNTMKHRIAMLAAALIALASLLHAAPAAAQPQQKPRVIQQFTTGWKFLQADAPGAEKPAFDDSAWMSVTLPHDWSIAGIDGIREDTLPYV